MRKKYFPQCSNKQIKQLGSLHFPFGLINRQFFKVLFTEFGLNFAIGYGINVVQDIENTLLFKIVGAFIFIRVRWRA